MINSGAEASTTEPITNMSSATSAVLGTPELLESILCKICEVRHMDWRGKKKGMVDLLRCQRVSKTFLATIQGSVKLQRLLFFRLNGSTGEEDSLYMQNGQRLISERRYETVNILLHRQGIEFEFQGLDITLDIGDESGMSPRVFIWLDIQHAEQNGTATASTDSWRKMLLAQPPLPSQVYCCSSRDPGRLGWLRAMMKYEVGMTLGEVVDRFLSWESDSKGGKNSPDWEPI